MVDLRSNASGCQANGGLASDALFFNEFEVGVTSSHQSKFGVQKHPNSLRNECSALKPSSSRQGRGAPG